MYANFCERATLSIDGGKSRYETVAWLDFLFCIFRLT